MCVHVYVFVCDGYVFMYVHVCVCMCDGCVNGMCLYMCVMGVCACLCVYSSVWCVSEIFVVCV